MTPPGDTNEVGVRVRVKNRRKFHADMDDSGDDVKKFAREAERANKSLSKVNAQFAFMRNIMRLVKPAALLTALGFMAQGASAAAAGLVALTVALGPASGALAVYPALALSAAQGLGVFKLATLGLSGALKDTTDALSEPTPAVLRFASNMENLLVPAMLSLRRAAQGPILRGLSAGAHAAMRSFGPLPHIVRLTAIQIGDLAAKAGRLVGSGPFGRDLAGIMRNNAVYIGRLGNGALNLVDGLRHILVTVQPLTNWLTKLALGWTQSFRASAKVGRETGKLNAFFRQTRFVLSQLFSITGAVAKSLWNIGKAGAPLGRTILKDLNTQAERFAAWTGSVSGQRSIAKWFNDAKPAIYETARLVRDVVKAFFQLGNQPGVASLIKQVRTDLLPVLVNLVGSTTKAFGPHLINALVQIVQLLGGLSGSSGVLTVFVDGLARGAQALNWLFQNVPGAQQLVVTMAALAGVMKAMQFGAMITGFQSLTKAIAAQKAVMMATTGATNVSTAATLRWRVSQIAASISAKATTAATVGQKIAMLATAVATRAAAAATAAWSLVTRSATLAMVAFNLVMSANPVVLVVAAIVALGVALVVAYKKVGWFRRFVDASFKVIKAIVMFVVNFIKNHWKVMLVVLTGGLGAAVLLVVKHFKSIRSFVGSVIGFIRNHWKTLLAILIGPVALAARIVIGNFGRIKSAASGAYNWIRGKFNALVSFITGLPGRIASAASGMFNGIKEAFRSAVNWIIDRWNGIEFKIPGIDPPGPGPKFPGVTIGVPDIPRLANGGLTRRAGAALVGDAGPELLSLPVGARVDPLPTPRVPNMKTIGSDGGSVDTFSDFDTPMWPPDLHLYIDGKEVAVAVKRHASDSAARK